MVEPSFLEIIQNAALLLALVFIFDVFVLRNKSYHSPFHQVAVGLLIGAIGVVVMLTPWVLMPGVIFDTRSVLLGISGLFFGALPTIVAMAITTAFRIYQGGGGALTGVLVILFTGTIGILWRLRRKHALVKISWKELYLFGLTIHLVMLALMFTLPWQIAVSVLTAISLPVLLIYPVVTVLLGILMVNREQRESFQKELARTTARLNTAQQITKVGGWEWDVIHRIMFWTDETYRIHGFSRSDIPPGSSEYVDKSIACYDPAFRPLIEKAFQECCEQGTPYELECPFTSLTGEQIWIRTEAQAILEKGKVVRVVGYIMDITERKKAEEKLRENEEFNRRIVHTANEGIWAMDQGTTTTFVNPKMAEMLGYQVDEMLGQPVTQFMLAEDIVDHDQKMTQRKSGQKGFYERRFARKDGSVIWTLVSSAPILSPEGEFIGSFGMFTDISERKLAENALRESEQKFSLAFRSSPYIITITRAADGVILDVNDSFYKITGYTEEETIGASSISLKLWVDPKDRQEVVNDLQRGESVIGREYHFVKKSGEIMIGLFSAGIIDIQDQVCILSSINDITERKRSEEALQKSETALIEAQTTAKIGSYEYEVSKDRSTWTKEMYRIFDYSPEMGELDWAVHRLRIHPQDWERIDQVIQNAIEPGIPYREEFRIVHRDGTVIWAETVGRPRRDDTGKIIQLFGTVQEITERRQAEEQIKASLAEKEVLLREIHHRVKNNLEVVLSLAEMQTRRMSDLQARQAMLQLQERIHTIALVHESIYRSPDLTHINVQQYLQKLIAHLYLAFDFSNINIQVDAAQINLSIETAIPCGLIVTELVTNAIKYAFPRPSLDSARTETAEPNQVWIKMFLEGPQVTLLVSDNGIGLPADFATQNSQSLGLRLVRGLVGQVHGTLEIISPPGVLFRIVFSIPAGVD